MYTCFGCADLFFFDKSFFFPETVYVGNQIPAVGTYILTFNVSDQCGNFNVNTLTIEVLNWVSILRQD